MKNKMKRAKVTDPNAAAVFRSGECTLANCPPYLIGRKEICPDTGEILGTYHAKGLRGPDGAECFFFKPGEITSAGQPGTPQKFFNLKIEIMKNKNIKKLIALNNLHGVLTGLSDEISDLRFSSISGNKFQVLNAITKSEFPEIEQFETDIRNMYNSLDALLTAIQNKATKLAK